LVIHNFTKIKHVAIFYISFLLYNISFCGAQEKLNGFVFDTETKKPLIGANIVVKDNKIGTITAVDGSFSLKWSGPFPVSIKSTYIGYSEEEVKVLDPSKTIFFYLKRTVIQVETINITKERQVSDNGISSNTETITTKESELRGIRDATEILQEMASVNISTTAWGKQSINIRGSNANAVSVFLDGAKLNRSIDGIADLSFIDMSSIKNVEIIRGGNSILFGPGNFGGVVILNSKDTKENIIKIHHTLGIADKSDQDIGGNINLMVGPIFFGSNYSYKIRMYDGRTKHISHYNNNAINFDHPTIGLEYRRMVILNDITYPSGFTLNADNMIINRANINFKLPLVGRFNLSGSIKEWAWEDDFFSNLQRTINDQTKLLKLGKEIAFKGLSGRVQVEQESNNHISYQNISDSYSEEIWIDSANLSRKDFGFSGVVKYSAKTMNQEIQNIRWEAGLRKSTSLYSHNQTIDNYSRDKFLENTYLSSSNKNTLLSFRVGSHLQGILMDKNYELFFNQGFNYRPPTLNDQLLWNTYNLIINKNDNKFSNLNQEYVSTTELSLKVFQKYDQSFVKSIELGAAVFRNNFIDKIYYQQFENNLLYPLNKNQSWINGMELLLKTKILNNLLKINSSITLLSLSEEIIFPNRPQLEGSTNVIFNWNSFSGSIIYLYEGRQNYLINGIRLDEIRETKNTNLSVSYNRRFSKFHFNCTYIIRNLFSDDITIMNKPDFQRNDFDYYDSHRKLFSIKLSYNNQKL
tara:strand:+ start:35851 stop:38103 length:2253 start_codon:yes stop_codon:yes gene_type:complete